MKNKNIFKINIIYFVALLLVAIVFVLGYTGILQNDILTSFLIQVVIMFALPLLMYSLLMKKNIKDTFIDCGFKKITGKMIGISIILGFVLYFINSFVADAFYGIISMFGYETISSSTTSSFNYGMLLKDLILSCMLPGFCEEFLHRGIMLHAGKKHANTRYCLIVSSLLFGLTHLNIRQFFYAAILGFLMGAVTLSANSIIPSIIIHFMNNALSVVMSYSRFHNLGLDFISSYTFDFINNNFMLGILFAIALVIILLVVLKWLVNKLFKTTILKQLNDLNQRILIEIERDDYFENMESIIKTGQIYKPSQMEDFARFKALFYHFGKEYGFTSKIKTAVGDEPIFRDKVATAFYVTSFIIYINLFSNIANFFYCISCKFLYIYICG